VAAGWRVVQVEQPWKVAGRRIAVAPPRLDVAWLAVLEALPDARRRSRPARGRRPQRRRAGGLPDGGPVGAAGVCCLAFPLHPPGKPEKSRADELRLVAGACRCSSSRGSPTRSAGRTRWPRWPVRTRFTPCPATTG
jgi:predicted alpha/beta-hydrolase family hydrolase